MATLTINNGKIEAGKETISKSDHWLDPLIKLSILLISVGFIFVAWKNNLLFSRNPLRFTGIEAAVFRYLFIVSAATFISAIVFRTILWFRYSHEPSAKVTDWPELTVVIPAYNEGKVIFDTIVSVFDCAYPAEKLKVIAVNDGSTDTTGFYLDMAKQRFDDRLDIIYFPSNRGKRMAIFEAFKRIRSPFMVTVDSDTCLESLALQEILTPLILDPEVGAVTGRIKVWNKGVNILTRMLHAHFAMAFDFTRAVQSTFSFVFCLAGAFSAYRMTTIRPIIEPWLHQQFLRKSCTFGEDRSLTNFVLMKGFKTKYQRTAIVHTLVPEKLKMVLKMLTRWARSNIRETIILARNLIHYRGNVKRRYPVFELISTVLPVFLHFVWFYYFLFSGHITGNFFIRIFAYSLLFGFFYSLYFIRIDGVRDVPYILFFSAFNCLFMMGIFTVAGATVTKTKWSTR